MEYIIYTYHPGFTLFGIIFWGCCHVVLVVYFRWFIPSGSQTWLAGEPPFMSMIFPLTCPFSSEISQLAIFNYWRGYCISSTDLMVFPRVPSLLATLIIPLHGCWSQLVPNHFRPSTGRGHHSHHGYHTRRHQCGSTPQTPWRGVVGPANLLPSTWSKGWKPRTSWVNCVNWIKKMSKKVVINRWIPGLSKNDAFTTNRCVFCVTVYPSSSVANPVGLYRSLWNMGWANLDGPVADGFGTTDSAICLLVKLILILNVHKFELRRAA